MESVLLTKRDFCGPKKKKYKLVLTIDSDLSHNPNLINKMLLMSRQYPIVITGRFLLKKTLVKWSIIRRIITITRHNLIKFLFSIPYDTSGAFRCYNLNKIKFNDLFLASDNGYSFFWQSLIILYKKGYKIKELPMIQPVRINGESKISISDIYKAFFKLIYFYITKEIKKNY